METKQSITKAELLDSLQRGQIEFPPFQILGVESVGESHGQTLSFKFDAQLTLRWGDRNYRFGVEACRLWTPKAVSQAMDSVQKKTKTSAVYPLVLVPYLSEEWLLSFETQGVSGLDLCGNGLFVVPGELLALRTGFPNCFRWAGNIKNVYRKNSSIVARMFLLVPEFRSVQEVLKEIQKRGGEVSLATVSKVCKSLEADLAIERLADCSSSHARYSPPSGSRQSKKRAQSRRGETSPLVRQTRLLQPRKLLDLLASNYAVPKIRRAFRGKCSLRPEELRKRVDSWANESGGKAVLTGACSVAAYAVMAREPMQSFYCTDIAGIVHSLSGDLRETDRFANVTLLETQDNFVYFDRRPGAIASPIQTYLELAAGDKRERETADQLRQVILAPLGQGAKGG